MSLEGHENRYVNSKRMLHRAMQRVYVSSMFKKINDHNYITEKGSKRNINITVLWASNKAVSNFGDDGIMTVKRGRVF